MSEITVRTRCYKNYEVAKEVKAYSVTMPCIKCDGEMKLIEMPYILNPPLNMHRCDKCGYEEEFLGVIYPRIEYR